MDKTRLAVIGLGNMGMSHCRDIVALESADLTAVCDVDAGKASQAGTTFCCAHYTSTDALFAAGGFDGIVIATPHYTHTTTSIEAFSRGIHVLTEKPVGVHVREIRKMVAAFEQARRTNENIMFSAMFQQRTKGAALKIKELIDGGELGKLMRMTWIITDWYRTQAYYNSGGWRATWAGEGGGVLMNQCPHQLDMYQWFAGCPDRVSGFASLGKYHEIEVEDEVTAYFEYDNGMVGHFITTTAEAPGTNRLEIVGEQGKLIWEDDKLTFYRNRVSLFTHLTTATKGFEKPEHWVCDIPFNEAGGQHRIIIENFCDAIAGRAELIAPASEGIHSIAMANAIMLSSFEKRMVEIPFDEELYEAKLKDLIDSSTMKKEVVEAAEEEFSRSF